MKALAFSLDRHLICAECFEKYFAASSFPNLLAVITRTKKVNSNNKCKECGNEYGTKSNQEIAERLSKVLLN